MDEIQFQAAEYVLGTLDAEELAQFEAQLATNPQVRAAVAAWQQRLTPLALRVADVAPPPDIWPRLARHLDDVPTPSRPPDSVAMLETVTALRAACNRWRRATLLVGAIAAGLAVFAVDRIIVEKQQATGAYVAVVNRGGDLPALIIRVDLASHSIFVRPVATQVPEGHSLELWYIGDGKSPKSMGLIDKATRNVPLPTGAQIDKASFAVSVEPPGGSPKNGPTGPVVYSGQLFKD